jgi:hypothetical protein
MRLATRRPAADPKAPVTKRELETLWRELEQHIDRLPEVYREVARNLYVRPIETWCSACHALFRRLHKQAVGR